MKPIIAAALIFLSQVLTTLAQTSEKASYLEKVFGLRWTTDRDSAVRQLESRPKMKRQKDFEGSPLFSGGDLLGHPASWWGLKFFGDRLIRVDAKLQAPGDSDRFYGEWQKRLNTLLGSSPSIKREGSRRISIWKITNGGPAGKGEVVVLQTIPSKPLIQVIVHDADLSKPK